MPNPPTNPKIYHIAHVDRLASVIESGGLLSDSVMCQRAGAGTTIGMGKIKQRRLSLAIECHRDTYVADYVPFYFCTRSVMLYLIYMGNHQDLTYRGGQGPIVHMESDLSEVVDWANEQGRKWCFSLSNAGACYTEFRNDLTQLSEINWPAVMATDFRQADIKEGKQAEFLLHGYFPWHLVRRIGVHSTAVAQQVYAATQGADHRPPVEIRTEWYY
ncbi:MAG: DUF4433 domain-containing protein [Alphaproteobacteria bacterium]|nr:DUF4433 domain-containing protein [Alphaproteobacteria bacterium]